MNDRPSIKDIKAVGREITVRKTKFGEYRVAYAIPAIQMICECDYAEAKCKNEASAYYTDDAYDAFNTALYMHAVYVNTPMSLKDLGTPINVHSK